MRENIIKNCSNCAHRRNDFEGDICLVSGLYIEIERQSESGDSCGRNFDMWVRKPNIFKRFLDYWR